MKSPLLLPELIDRTASEAPEREAIAFLDRSLSYAELATRSNQLAHA
ncbi:MAG: long-chain fatty acid--CoA ligase, partial [Akkermansiaceae bacterium]|nr:long-chain fatty acid--CoA ligase [Akkermansiaceae bacterium]